MARPNASNLSRQSMVSTDLSTGCASCAVGKNGNTHQLVSKAIGQTDFTGSRTEKPRMAKSNHGRMPWTCSGQRVFSLRVSRGRAVTPSTPLGDG